MAALEFKFSSDQQHQLEAIEATCDLFRGQQFIGSVFSADSGRKGQTAIGELMVGHGNELRVAPGQLLDNLHAVGGLLAGATRWREKSGDAIALVSALRAADSILGSK